MFSEAYIRSLLQLYQTIINPITPFEMNTPLAWFKTDIAHKVNAILIYDVTKTTEDITVTNRTAQLKILHFF